MCQQNYDYILISVKHSKRENGETNNVIIYVMIVVLLVLAAVCILFFLRKKGKLPLPYICGSNANLVHRHGRDILLREPQVTDQFIPQLNGVVIHHSNGDLPSGGPQETDQFIPQPNGFVSHHSNGEVVHEANKDDSLPSQQIIGNGVGVIEDVPVKSKPHSEAELVTKTSTAERGNTELIGEILDDTSLKNVSTLKDLASATFTEVNEESLPQQQNAGHEEENKEDVPDFVSVPSNQSELVTSVAATRSKTLEPYNTEPGGVSVDETSLKDVTASSDVTASDPDRGFQYIISDVQETKKNSPGNIKFRKEYLSSFVRKESFNSPLCEWSLSNPSIKQMAKAGFFCSGYETSAQCFSCGAKRCWQEGDDPFHEHFHDSCRHLKHIKETQASGEGS
ncbi:unnamed protein product [Mytilus coruscus]|uniref:BIRC7_8 n=1 Tax=Mytilus coruscus TaxID=42192 RepID=A0A6J8CN36_MYTCO|nr:unnamed protein product [Mytilus coruscus]